MQGSVLGLLTVLAAGIPSAVSAYFAYRSSRALRTGNDKTVGEMMTETHGVLSIEKTPYETHGTVGQ